MHRLLPAIFLLTLVACGEEDDGGFLPPTGGSSGSGGDDGGADELPEELGYDRDGIWVRLDAGYEGLYGVPPAFQCGTTGEGLYEVEGSVVLDGEDEGFRAARLYFAHEPEAGDVYRFAAPEELNAVGTPAAVPEGTVVLVVVEGSGPETETWMSLEGEGELTIELLNGATQPRFRWLEASLEHADDGEAALSEAGHLRCG